MNMGTCNCPHPCRYRETFRYAWRSRCRQAGTSNADLILADWSGAGLDVPSGIKGQLWNETLPKPLPGKMGKKGSRTELKSRRRRPALDPQKP